MKHVFALRNGREFSEVKCPICGKIMEVDTSEYTHPRSDFMYTPRPSPFSGIRVDSITEFDMTMKCHDCDCTLKFADCHITQSIGEIY